jgi:hypothetical protein
MIWEEVGDNQKDCPADFSTSKVVLEGCAGRLYWKVVLEGCAGRLCWKVNWKVYPPYKVSSRTLLICQMKPY